jgi:hypothetical protein
VSASCFSVEIFVEKLNFAIRVLSELVRQEVYGSGDYEERYEEVLKDLVARLLSLKTGKPVVVEGDEYETYFHLECTEDGEEVGKTVRLTHDELYERVVEVV